MNDEEKTVESILRMVEASCDMTAEETADALRRFNKVFALPPKLIKYMATDLGCETITEITYLLGITVASIFTFIYRRHGIADFKNAVEGFERLTTTTCNEFISEMEDEND